MTKTMEMWARGLGSTGIQLQLGEDAPPKGSPMRAKWEALNSAWRAVQLDPANEPYLRRLAVAQLNRGLVTTGQLFEIDDTGSVTESHVVQDRLRDMLAVFMCE